MEEFGRDIHLAQVAPRSFTINPNNAAIKTIAISIDWDQVPPAALQQRLPHHAIYIIFSAHRVDKDESHKILFLDLIVHELLHRFVPFESSPFSLQSGPRRIMAVQW